ncbi:MAG TPA: hypothetical protein VJ574_02905 [Candidatus Bathyarchaeia archaeon]|nr:hypothetical protein [Candidatus Bathyarchaeia archaeon]
MERLVIYLPSEPSRNRLEIVVRAARRAAEKLSLDVVGAYRKDDSSISICYENDVGEERWVYGDWENLRTEETIYGLIMSLVPVFQYYGGLTQPLVITK